MCAVVQVSDLGDGSDDADPFEQMLPTRVTTGAQQVVDHYMCNVSQRTDALSYPR
jgi:hypothetical protein